MRVFVLAAAMAATFPVGLAVADDQEKAVKLLEEAASAQQNKKYKEAIDLATKAAKLDPKNPAAPFVVGSAQLSLRQYEEAVKSFTNLIALEPKFAAAYGKRGDAYSKLSKYKEAVADYDEYLKAQPNDAMAFDRCGDAHLKLGMFKEAIADFDEYLKAHPQFAPEHWRRGIALYYAGRYADGVKQFDLHRTVNPEDVENSAWHYLCNARANTPKKAREDLIPVTKDARVPMKQVLELFAGKLKPQDVLDAAEKAKLEGDAQRNARFYANLYVALYYESEGEAKKALEHLTAAVEKYKNDDYMWDVADAHLKMLKAKKN